MLAYFATLIIFSANADFFNPPKEVPHVKEARVEELEPEGLNKKIFKTIGGWTLLTAKPNEKKICYAVAYPKKHITNMEPSEKDNESYIIFHYFSRFQSRFSYHSNLINEGGNKLSVEVEQDSIHLMKYEDFAIAKNYNDEQEITQMMYLGNTMHVNIKNINGQYFIEEFDIHDFAKVYDELSNKCLNPEYSSAIKKKDIKKKDA